MAFKVECLFRLTISTSSFSCHLPCTRYKFFYLFFHMSFFPASVITLLIDTLTLTSFRSTSLPNRYLLYLSNIRGFSAPMNDSYDIWHIINYVLHSQLYNDFL